MLTTKKTNWLSLAFLWVGLLSSPMLLAQSVHVPTTIKFADLQLTLNEDARKQIERKAQQLREDTAYYNNLRERVYTYLPIIMRTLKAQGLPEDMAYVALKETSLLQANVDERKMPAGVWKITPNQNDDWKLRLVINSKIDERKHLGLATAALARKMKNDNYSLRNWLNTVLAYGFGYMEVSQTANPQDKGATTMQLHGQTNPYLIDLLAYMVVFKDTDFKPSPKSLTLLEYSDSKDKSLNLLAKMVGLSEMQLRAYNPWLAAKSVPDDKSYTVYFPATEAQKEEMRTILNKQNTMLPIEQYQQTDFPLVIKQQSVNINDKIYTFVSANGLKAIMVDTKDTPANLIKMTKDLSLSKFVRYNDIKETDTLFANLPYYLEEKRKTAEVPFHDLAAKETYWLVAQKYGMQYESLLDFNRMTEKDPAQVGRLLWLQSKRDKNTQVEIRTIAAPIESEPTNLKNQTNNSTGVLAANAAPEDPNFNYYTAIDTENIYDVSWRLGVRVDSLRKWNNLKDEIGIDKGRRLIVGRKPAIKPTIDNTVATNQTNQTATQTNGTTNPSTEISKTAENVIKENAVKNLPKQLTHTVQSKEGLAAVARKYGVALKTLIADNKIADPNKVKAGDKLVVNNPTLLPPTNTTTTQNATPNATPNTTNGATLPQAGTGTPANNTAVATNTQNTTQPNTTQNTTQNTTPPNTQSTATFEMTKTTTNPTQPFVEQPFLKDSVYLVRNDNENFESIAKKLNLPKKGEYDYSLYLKMWNPTAIDREVTTTEILPKGFVVRLADKPLTISQEAIKAAMGEGTAPTNATPNTNTGIATNTPDLVTANTVVAVRYEDYKDSTYMVQSGEYLYLIAKKTGLPDYRYLLRWNGYKTENPKLDIGDRLIVKGDLSVPIENTPMRNGKVHHTQLGENIYSIAKFYNTSADSLAKWNGLQVDSVLPLGKDLIVSNSSFHTVQKGENLVSIAKAYNMSVEDFAKLNKMGVHDKLAINQKLLVETPIFATSQPNYLTASGKDPVQTTAAAQPFQNIYLVYNDGETLKSIAEKLKLPDVADSPFSTYMKQWNNVEENQALPKGTAVKIAENAVMPAAEQIQAAMQQNQTASNPNQQNTGLNTNAVGNQTTQNLNKDALLTAPQTKAPKKYTSSQPFKDVHIVRLPNETLQTIAEKYKFQPIGGHDYALYMQTWNNATSTNEALPLGKAVRLTDTAVLPSAEDVAALQSSFPPTAGNGTHTVQANETLYTIAKQYNIDKKYLEVWNKVDDDTPLKSGQVLIVQGNMQTEVPQYSKFYTDTYHIAQDGETLTEIAKFHNISLANLLEMNNLTSKSALKEGQKLWIKPRPAFHKVWQGETIAIIAELYEITTQDIYSWNNFPANYVLKQGETIIVSQSAVLPPKIEEQPLPPTAPKEEVQPVAIPQNLQNGYFAQMGESITDVCRRFGISTIDFKLWNQLPYNADKLEEGRKYYLVAPPVVKSAPAGNANTNVNPTVNPNKATTTANLQRYTVGKNETLYAVARKFNISIYQLREWNNLKSDVVKEGDNLVVGKNK